jgi:drug/metabolite transporter (DMT)-like permease
VPSTPRRQGLLALVIVIAAWGLTWPVNKVVLATLSPLWAVTLRSAIATLALFAIAAWRGRVTLPPRQDLPVLLSITLLHMVGFNLLASWGLGLVPPAAPWCSPTPRRSGSRRARRSSCASRSRPGA